MQSIERLTASDAVTLLIRGEISAEELTTACLQRIEQQDSKVQAWASIDPEFALEQARDADRRYIRHERLGALHGIPIGIKDIIDTKDLPTGHGSALFSGNQADKDAECVTRLRTAGAVILGKTVTTELANTYPSKTRNPHRLEHTPGGSSSGSAAAVADKQVPLALGTQTGGSVIRPASFCGVYALKPTFGKFSRSGVLLQSHSLDTVGIFARCIDDLALLTEALDEQGDGLMRYDSRRPLDRAPKLALLRTPAWSHIDETAGEALLDIADRLGIDEIDPLGEPFNSICELHKIVMGAENAAYYGAFYTENGDLLSAELRHRLADSLTINAADYIRALNQRERAYTQIAAILDRYDALLCPASAGPAPASLASTGTPIFNGLWTYLGVPCLSLPLLQLQGMPYGVQLVGKLNFDAGLLRIGRWLADTINER